MVEMDMFNVQRAITQKVSKAGLRFMCSARLTVFYIVKFGAKAFQSYGADTNDGSADERTSHNWTLIWYSMLNLKLNFHKQNYKSNQH